MKLLLRRAALTRGLAAQGPYLRRFQPRAQGRAYPIRKPTCSIHVKMKSHETSTRIKGPIKIGTH